MELEKTKGIFALPYTYMLLNVLKWKSLTKVLEKQYYFSYFKDHFNFSFLCRHLQTPFYKLPLALFISFGYSSVNGFYLFLLVSQNQITVTNVPL